MRKIKAGNLPSIPVAVSQSMYLSNAIYLFIEYFIYLTELLWYVSLKNYTCLWSQIEVFKDCF